MNGYSVKDISELLGVNVETVRRWIRDGKFSETGEKPKDPKKAGHVVSQKDLDYFLSRNKKYQSDNRKKTKMAAKTVGGATVLSSMSSALAGISAGTMGTAALTTTGALVGTSVIPIVGPILAVGIGAVLCGKMTKKKMSSEEKTKILASLYAQILVYQSFLVFINSKYNLIDEYLSIRDDNKDELKKQLIDRMRKIDNEERVFLTDKENLVHFGGVPVKIVTFSESDAETQRDFHNRVMKLYFEKKKLLNQIGDIISNDDYSEKNNSLGTRLNELEQEEYDLWIEI